MKKYLELGWSGEYFYPPYQKFGPGTRSCYIIHFVISGKGYFTVDGKTVEIGENRAFIIYKGDSVEYHADRENPWHYVWIDFDGEMCDALLEKTGFSKQDRVTPPLAPEKILPIFDTMRQNFTSELAGLSAFIRLITEIAEVFPAASIDEGSGSLAERAMRLISKSYRSLDCRVEKLAELLSVSRSQLFRAFKTKYGVSPKEYIDELRIAFAKRLLAGDASSVSEVCYSSGFSDPLYFSGLFKRKTGVSPSEFKEKMVKRCPPV